MSATEAIERFRNMFDRVRVRTTAATEAAGFAGITGQVYGETVPSSSGVGRDQIIGEMKEDYAVNVNFKELNKSVWFTRDLLEFVDHAPGTEITAGSKTRVRTETGEWIEKPGTLKSPSRSDIETDNRRVKIIAGVLVGILVIILLISILKRL